MYAHCQANRMGLQAGRKLLRFFLPPSRNHGASGMKSSSLFIGLSVAGFTFAVASAQPANDGCAAPQAINGFGTFNWDTTGATTDGPVECITIHNDVWFCWTAPRSGPTRAETCGGP